MQKNNKVIMIGIISVIVIITLSITISLLIYVNKDNDNKIDDLEVIDEIIDDEDEFVSTDEKPYDTSVIDEEEAKKDIVDKDDLILVKETIIPMIEKGSWKEALNYISEYFETNTYKTEEGKILQTYQNDLNIMVQMSGVPRENYDYLFQNFEAPETFLACMIYYPPSVKLSGFLTLDSLVPTTEKNNVLFYELKEHDDAEMIENINKNFNDEYKRVLSQEFELDGKIYIAYIAEKKDGKYMMYRIDAISEDSHFMDVEKWMINLNYKNK